jgi:hypothetical protein
LCRPTARLAARQKAREEGSMWREPYLETCCRSALHRVILSGNSGRPPGLADHPCLMRLQRQSLVEFSPPGRFVATLAGKARHRTEILHCPAEAATPPGGAASP